MIAEIRLENFKRFRDLTLNTANLTVLTGANGAGKTSVLHSLLLARQMARQPDRSHVELNGVDALELGGPEDVIHREASDDVAAVEVLDTEGIRRRWSFRATGTTDTRTLNAAVVDRPDDYSGALAGPAPRFSYLCAERLGPRDVLGASAADMAELDVGSRGEFVAQVLASFDRSRIRTGRLVSSTTETQISSLLHQTESWMGKIVRPIQIEVEWFPNTSITRLRCCGRYGRCGRYDLSTVERWPESHVSKSLRGVHQDRVWRVRLRDRWLYSPGAAGVPVHLGPLRTCPGVPVPVGGAYPRLLQMLFGTCCGTPGTTGCIVAPGFDRGFPRDPAAVASIRRRRCGVLPWTSAVCLMPVRTSRSGRRWFSCTPSLPCGSYAAERCRR